MLMTCRNMNSTEAHMHAAPAAGPLPAGHLCKPLEARWRRLFKRAPGMCGWRRWRRRPRSTCCWCSRSWRPRGWPSRRWCARRSCACARACASWAFRRAPAGMCLHAACISVPTTSLLTPCKLVSSIRSLGPHARPILPLHAPCRWHPHKLPPCACQSQSRARNCMLCISSVQAS